MFSDGQQDHGILKRLEAMTGFRDDEEIPRRAVPRLLTRNRADPPGEHVDDRLAGVSVLIQGRPGGERDQCLMQDTAAFRRGRC